MEKYSMGEHEVNPVSDAELEAANRRGLEADVAEARATAVAYDVANHDLRIALRGGLLLVVPVSLLQGLTDADPALLAKVELGAGGRSLHWEELDADFSLQALVAGSFGTRRWMQKLSAEGRLDQASQERLRQLDILYPGAAEMGRRGGRATSAAKQAASRLNGAKGGRPRKTSVAP